MLAAFFLWEWYHPNPIVDVRLLKNRNFGTAVCVLLRPGNGLVRFHRLDSRISAKQPRLHGRAGRPGALAGGLVLMLMMFVAGRLIATKIDPRLLICIGFLGTAFALRLMTNIYLQIDFPTIVLLRCFQVIFMPLIFIPISTLNYVGVPREKNNQVSGISSFMRNIGGSIGTSGLSVFLTRQNQTHQVAFASHTSMGDPNFRQFLNGLTAMFMSQGYDAATAAKKAMAMAYFTVQSQAGALSFKNGFFVMSVMIACLSPLPFIMRRPKQGEASRPRRTDSPKKLWLRAFVAPRADSQFTSSEKLEDVFQSELNQAWVHRRGGDLPERAGRRDCQIRSYGIRELRMIERVEKLSSEYDHLPFGDMRGLDQGDIEVEISRTKNGPDTAIPEQGGNAVRACGHRVRCGRLGAECADVQIALAAAVHAQADL